MMPTHSAYPPDRPPFFANKVARLLIKTAAANEIGPEGCWLVTIIALTEDAKRYTAPVLFWNESLQNVCGFDGRARLVSARKKAVAARWLHYERGGKGKAGRYWSLIPDEYKHLEDGAVDENPSEYRSETERQADGNQTETGRQVDGNQTDTERLSSLNPDPSPNPKRGGGKRTGGDRSSRDVDAATFPIPAELDTTACRDALAEWIRYRKSIKRPCKSAFSVTKLLDGFREYGPDAFVDAVDLSIANEWQGVFPPKGRKQNGHSSDGAAAFRKNHQQGIPT